ncbi:MAG: nucleotidyltransferase domain-containing protein [Gammaproteobacteria bacterium]|nr:nucleotidyltransferase domain-containing protein [Gammaproteobacteria bacterium]
MSHDTIKVLDPGYQTLYAAVLAWAEVCPEVRALFVSGSLAEGTADRFSDLDLLAIADTPRVDEVEKVIAGVEQPIIAYRLPPGENPFVLSVVTNAWHRVDVAFSSTPVPGAVPVYDPEGLDAGPAQPVVPPRPTAEQVRGIVIEFFRVYGLSVVVLGRGDVHAAHEGANLMREHLVNMLLLETPIARPGLKKLLPALTEEQQSILRSLPPLQDNEQVLRAFNEAIDSVFVERARTLLKSLGGSWPRNVEGATRAYLKNNTQT